MVETPLDSLLSPDAQLAAFAASMRSDPLAFVLASYPWRQPFLSDGSYNPLAYRDGPEPWQRKLLTDWGNHIRANDQRIAIGLDPLVFRAARASGHGVGKSAMVSWAIQFTMATRAKARGTITANTQRQLEDKTWPELAKWHAVFLFKRWFAWTATTYTFALGDAETRKNYMMTAATVGEDNVEAFQGLHNAESAVLIIFDEASGIHPKIWEAAVGATTDGEVFNFFFGNPTQQTGMFADCFVKNKRFYNTAHIDSREVSFTNKRALQDIIDIYGADSDEARVRVYGQFPHQAFNEFISKAAANEAATRPLVVDHGAALIMSVDCARFGVDEAVIAFRQGKDARSRPRMVFKGLSNVKLADIIADMAHKYRPDVIIIEAPGGGEGIIDICREIKHLKVVEFWPGALAADQGHFYRKRDEIWAAARDWVIDGGCIDDDAEFVKQLTGILYGYDKLTGKLRIESKELYKERTQEHSPDRADAFVLSFGVKVLRRDHSLYNRAIREQAQVSYDEFSPDEPLIDRMRRDGYHQAIM